MVNAKEMALAAAKALDSKKGRDIKVLEIDKITTLADYFVIATGSSNTQINALCGAVEKTLKEQAGELPLRVTHNDTKLNNVLLDAKTRKALCVIDLDTVMPGSSLYDFGDSIRFGAATAAEDERDLSRMEMSLERFCVFTRGYVRSCPGLTQKELELLPLGAKTMTMECGVRFLTDYLDGDHYFAVHRDGQNLDRARTQFRLVADMEKKWNEMQKIVAEEANKER